MRTCKRFNIGLLLCAVVLLQCVHSNFSLLNPSSQKKSLPPADRIPPPVEPKPADDSTSSEPISPSRKTNSPPPAPQEPADVIRNPADTLDFTLAFSDTPVAVPAEPATRLTPGATPSPDFPAFPPSVATGRIGLGHQGEYPPFVVRKSLVRVLLKSNCTEAVVYTLGALSAADGRRNTMVPDRGRLALRCTESGVHIATSSGKTAQFALPCTLSSADAGNIIEVESGSYRGNIILIPARPGRFSIVNYLPVEEYLRGVVPLELGKRPEAALEALKAQAVAARTYTFARMSRTLDSSYDLLPTVADQVYGGVTAEYAVSDRAIELTAGVVLLWNNAPIAAYYHSTCGGTTANIQDVWNKDPAPYLIAINDCDRSGTSYCAASRLYNWEETWGAEPFAAQVKKFGRPYMNEGTFDGRIESVRVNSRFQCGRVRILQVMGSKGETQLKGDKIRFALRRGVAGNPILHSARFDVVKAGSSGVVLKGSGSGHGVGMCQMGALGRAAAGQNFEQILKAYYTGVELRTAIGE